MRFIKLSLLVVTLATSNVFAEQISIWTDLATDYRDPDIADQGRGINANAMSSSTPSYVPSVAGYIQQLQGNSSGGSISFTPTNSAVHENTSYPFGETVNTYQAAVVTNVIVPVWESNNLANPGTTYGQFTVDIYNAHHELLGIFQADLGSFPATLPLNSAASGGNNGNVVALNQSNTSGLFTNVYNAGTPSQFAPTFTEKMVNVNVTSNNLLPGSAATNSIVSQLGAFGYAGLTVELHSGTYVPGTTAANGTWTAAPGHTAIWNANGTFKLSTGAQFQAPELRVVGDSSLSTAVLGTSKANAILPMSTTANNGVGFHLETLPDASTGLGRDQFVWLDPNAATRFEYQVTGGELFQSFTLPDAGQFQLELWNGHEFVFAQYITGGAAFSFINPVDRFEIVGLTPFGSDIGVTFAGTGAADVTITPVDAVPEPSSFALLGLGGIGLAFGAYRRRRAETTI